jgi:hypothetical protein
MYFILTKMPTSSGRYAILFEEGPGYLHSGPLRNGFQGEVYLVISLRDCKFYIRKYLWRGNFSRELPFYNRIPTSMAPELIARKEYTQPKGNAKIFPYCYGDDLLHFKSKVTNAGRKFPDVMY